MIFLRLSVVVSILFVPYGPYGKTPVLAQEGVPEENVVESNLRPLTLPDNGRPRGGRGPGPEMRADQELFHFLLEHHEQIQRKVTRLENGVETVTESEDSEVALKIQEHVASMHQRISEGRGLRFWDDLFAEIFSHYAQIEMVVENTERGVRVRETSDDPFVVALIQAHADVVSQFVSRGFAEAHENHPVPASGVATESPNLVFPIIADFGGIRARPDAVDQPQAGVKVVFDVTAGAEPSAVNSGLVRVARLLNLYGAADLDARDVTITVVLHGEATKSALADSAYSSRFEVEHNPNLPLIRRLHAVGVEVLVCGQALNNMAIRDADVADEVTIAASALTVVINRQNAGYSYLPVP